MEFGNFYLRQQEVSGWRGHIYHTAMQRGYSHEEASEITDEVIYETNTTYEDVEPIWDVIRMLIEKICTEKETPPTDGPSTEHVKLVG